MVYGESWHLEIVFWVPGLSYGNPTPQTTRTRNEYMHFKKILTKDYLLLQWGIQAYTD